jgi:multidrug efflux pump subunit AcrA (membrane-fusion protein)
VRPRVLILLFLLVAVVGGVLTQLSLRGRERKEPDEEAPIVAPSRLAEREGEPRVVLDSDEVRRIGLTTVALAPATAQGRRRLPGQVIPEPERTVTVRAPVAGRLTVAEGGRWPSLGERLPVGAPLGRVSDAQPLSVPIAGAVTAVGARPGEIVEAGQMLLELADNSHPVVRVAWPAEAGRAADRVMLLPSDGSGVEARLIGPAPEADPLTRQPTYLYRAHARWPGAVPGTPVAASLPDGAKVEGVLVPDAAVVQWEGLAWAYLRRGPGEYARVPVSTDQPAPGGWVAGPPLAAGDSVVVTGAQELLSEEFRARVTVGEESGE